MSLQYFLPSNCVALVMFFLFRRWYGSLYACWRGPCSLVRKSIRPYMLGRLRNEVMERKHREMKILNSNQGRRRWVSKENKCTFQHDRMCLVNEMRVQFVNLVMRLEGSFQKFRQRRFFPSNIRSQLRVEYDKSRNQLNKEIAAQLASCFLDVTCQ